MGNLCSKIFNVNNSNLKEKLIDDSTKNPIEDLDNNITIDPQKKVKKKPKPNNKKKKDNDSDNNIYDEDSESDEDTEKENKSKKKNKKKIKKEDSDEDSESDDSEKVKKPKKRKKKNNKKKKKKEREEESDSESEDSEYENLEDLIKKKKNKLKIEELNYEQTEQKIIEPEYQDLPQKRKLAVYLLSNDYAIFKRHLMEVQKLSDEEFNELFEGNTDYQKFNVKNQKEFNQVVQKFDDNKDLIMEWYNREDYYKFVLQIWKPNILQKLKNAENQNEKKEILKQYKIDTSSWDNTEFSVHFNTCINQSPIKDYAERMKKYIKADYGDFDELIKSVDKCKTNIKNSEETSCKETIKSNIDTTMTKIINEFVPNFITSLSNGYNEFNQEKEKKEEEMANKRIKNYFEEVKLNKLCGKKDSKCYNNFYLNGISEKNKKLLVKEVKQLYAKEDALYNTDNKIEMEKIKELSKKFNEEGEKVCKIGLIDQSKMLFNNNQFKNAVLGLSIANVTYTYLHLGQTFINFNKNFLEFKTELERIKRNFEKHKKEVELIPDDIDEAVEQIIKTGQKFKQDLDDIDELINNIKNEINNQDIEKGKAYGNLVASTALTAMSAIGTHLTGDKKYGGSTAANIAALVGNVIDIKKINKNIEEYEKIYKEAEDLRNEINQEIDKLRNKFNNLSTKHFG